MSDGVVIVAETSTRMKSHGAARAGVVAIAVRVKIEDPVKIEGPETIEDPAKTDGMTMEISRIGVDRVGTTIEAIVETVVEEIGIAIAAINGETVSAESADPVASTLRRNGTRVSISGTARTPSSHKASLIVLSQQAASPL
jgi:hypothetical protein